MSTKGWVGSHFSRVDRVLVEDGPDRSAGALLDAVHLDDGARQGRRQVVEYGVGSPDLETES